MQFKFENLEGFFKGTQARMISLSNEDFIFVVLGGLSMS